MQHPCGLFSHNVYCNMFTCSAGRPAGMHRRKRAEDIPYSSNAVLLLYEAFTTTVYTRDHDAIVGSLFLFTMCLCEQGKLTSSDKPGSACLSRSSCKDQSRASAFPHSSF